MSYYSKNNCLTEFEYQIQENKKVTEFLIGLEFFESDLIKMFDRKPVIKYIIEKYPDEDYDKFWHHVIIKNNELFFREDSDLPQNLREVSLQYYNKEIKKRNLGVSS